MNGIIHIITMGWLNDCCSTKILASTPMIVLMGKLSYFCDNYATYYASKKENITINMDKEKLLANLQPVLRVEPFTI
jgi:hypothetical protein